MKKVLFLAVASVLLIAPVAPSADAEGGWDGESLLSGPFGTLSTVAQISRGFPCGVGFAITTDSQCTQSSSGNETLQCRGELPATILPPPSTVQFTVLCGTCFSGLTIGTLSVTPSGAIKLTCQT